MPIHNQECRFDCVCPPGEAVRLPEGNVNLGAFLAHVICVTCKSEVSWDYDCDTDVEENGGDINVAWHGSCPGCGKLFTLEVSHVSEDAPAETLTERTPVTEAEKIAKFNRRGIAT